MSENLTTIQKYKNTNKNNTDDRDRRHPRNQFNHRRRDYNNNRDVGDKIYNNNNKSRRQQDAIDLSKTKLLNNNVDDDDNSDDTVDRNKSVSKTNKYKQ